MRVKVRVYEAEEGGYWAVVPGLPNCVSEGETLEEVKQNVAEALQGLQSQACCASGWWRRGYRPRTRRNDDQLLGVRQGDHCAVPSDAGASGLLPRMFPIAEVRWRRGRLTSS